MTDGAGAGPAPEPAELVWRWAQEAGMSVRRVGEGPPIVWIHGLGESSVSFEPVVRALPGFTHVLPDLPGYGRSSWANAPETLDALADHLALWIADEPGGPVHLIGHSMGGVLGTLIAERQRVSTLINVDGNITIGDCNFSGKAAAYSLDDFCDHGFAALRAGVYRDGLTSAALRGYASAMHFAAPHVFHAHAVELVRYSMGLTLAGWLAALPVPALFVAGVPHGICEESRAMLDKAGVRWVGLSPAGHWVYLDQLDAFTDLVTRFLGGGGAGAGSTSSPASPR